MIIQCALVDDSLNDIQIIKNTVFYLCYGTDTMIQISSFQTPSDTNILNPFDMYILDIDMPDMNGFDLANKIYEKYPNAVIIFCTMHDNLVYDSFRLNAFYFVRKNNLEEDQVTEIIGCVHINMQLMVQHYGIMCTIIGQEPAIEAG
jgi:DNA-binding LytR/AlgR family response regulator